jgi:hypothetical protein
VVTDVVIVEFSKSGGVTGLQQKMIISNNGHGILTGPQGANPNGFDLDESAMANLRQTLESARIDAFSGQRFPCEGADMFEYSITHMGDTLTMCEDHVPEQLRAAVGLLEEIARANGGE